MTSPLGKDLDRDANDIVEEAPKTKTVQDFPRSAGIAQVDRSLSGVGGQSSSSATSGVHPIGSVARELAETIDEIEVSFDEGLDEISEPFGTKIGSDPIGLVGSSVRGRVNSISTVPARPIEEEGCVTINAISKIDLDLARKRLREAGLDDDLQIRHFQDSDKPALGIRWIDGQERLVGIPAAALEWVIARRYEMRNNLIQFINKRGEFKREWWQSSDMVERVWGQLHVTVMILPEWQFVQDLEMILGENVAAIMPSWDVKASWTQVLAYMEILKKKVAAKLVNRYPKEYLDAIIARKPVIEPAAK